MIAEIKAEFRKVFTVRSTYIILGLMFALVVFFSFYVGGWHTDKADLLDPHRLYRITQQSVNLLSIFPPLIAVLLFCHEFRYNTAAYTLTLSNNRNKVLVAKIIVVSIIALIATVFMAAAAPLLADWGIHANSLKLVHQSYYFWGIAWRALIFGWGYAMAALVIAALVRNQIGAIVALFIVPGTVEGLLSIWLKNNTVYLPFSALHNVLGAGMDVSNTTVSPVRSIFVFLGYLVVGWVIAWYLFLKRDVM